MKKDPKVIGRLLKSLELSALSTRTRIARLQVQAKTIEENLVACTNAVEKPYMLNPLLSASLGKRVGQLHSKLATASDQIARAVERRQIEELRQEKVGHWLEKEWQSMDEAQLQEITEESLVNQIRASQTIYNNMAKSGGKFDVD